MSHSTEYNAFTRLVDKVLSVPRTELLRREAEYKRQAAMNPHRRGPKPKAQSRTRTVKEV